MLVPTQAKQIARWKSARNQQNYGQFQACHLVEQLENEGLYWHAVSEAFTRQIGGQAAK